MRPTVFDARRPHCTEEWTGTRWCLTMYTGRSLKSTSRSLRTSLRSFGFPITPDKFQETEGDEKRLPKRSKRRTLWKNAKRMSALATWSVLAASSMATTDATMALGLRPCLSLAESKRPSRRLPPTTTSSSPSRRRTSLTVMAWIWLRRRLEL